MSHRDGQPLPSGMGHLKEVILMILYGVQEYRDYRLPPEFWRALAEVRSYLYQQREVADKVFSLDDLDDDLRAAFCFVDTVIEDVMSW